MVSRWAAAALGALMLTASSPALAQDPPPGQSQADILFQEAKALMEQGAINDACSKFAESLELVRRGGTLLNLAVCREKQGRYATAFRLYQDALAFAVADRHEDREKIARDAIEALRSKLSWLMIKPGAGADVPGLVVTRDGQELAAADWNALAPVDPGPHEVTATAPGRERFEIKVTVGDSGDRQVVEIPVLALTPEAPAPPSLPQHQPAAAPPPPPPHVTGWTKPVGIASLGVGLAAVAIGGVFGVKAILDEGDFKRLCPDQRCTTDMAWSNGNSSYNSARTAARVSDIALPVGAAVAGLGISLLILGGPNHAPHLLTSERTGAGPEVRLAPTAGPGGPGASLAGTW